MLILFILSEHLRPWHAGLVCGCINAPPLESMQEQGEPTSDELSAALRTTHIRLHRALQKSASQAGFDYSLSVMQEVEAREFLHQDFASLSLVVVALERPHHVSQGYASHCVRHSRQPVLVVPSG